MNINDSDNSTDDTMKLLSYLAILVIIILSLRECSSTNIKARAFEKMEEDRSISSDEALEDAEYEHDEAIDGMIENQIE